MRDWRLWIGILSIGVVLSAGLTQTDTPLINYATLHGEFDYDYFYGNPSVGLVRDGVAEGFRATVPEGFTLELDESDKISGLASQKISFTRNSMQSAEVSLTMDMHFPSDDYPQPGETILITLWLKTENWNNASIRIRARGLNGSGAADLYNSSSALQAWTQLSFNYIVPTSNPRGIALELRVRRMLELPLVLCASTNWKSQAVSAGVIIALARSRSSHPTTRGQKKTNGIGFITRVNSMRLSLTGHT
jgi:hypothetical protein